MTTTLTATERINVATVAVADVQADFAELVETINALINAGVMPATVNLDRFAKHTALNTVIEIMSSYIVEGRYGSMPVHPDEDIAENIAENFTTRQVFLASRHIRNPNMSGNERVVVDATQAFLRHAELFFRGESETLDFLANL